MLLAGVAIVGCGGSGHRQPASTGGGSSNGSGTTTSGGTSTGGGAAWASLHISYRAHRLSGTTQVWTLTCRPTGGDHPQASTACAELAAHPQALTGGGRGQITCGVVVANGPSVLVTGTIGGQSVHYSPVSICNLGWSELPVLLTGSTSETKSG